MTFKEATDRLAELGVPATLVASELGRSVQVVRQMRMPEGHAAYRSPPAPDLWRPALAKLARARAEALTAFADTL